MLPSQLADSFPKCKEEFLLIRHYRGTFLAWGNNDRVEMSSFSAGTFFHIFSSEI